MIKIDKARLVISIIIGVILTILLSFNSLNLLLLTRNVEIDNLNDVGKLEDVRSGSFVNIKGTPNSLYSVVDGSGNHYFSLEEYGFTIIVKSNIPVDYSEPVLFTGKIEQLKNIEGNEKLISKLNNPIETDGFEDFDLTSEQIKNIEDQAKGEFTLDTYLLSYSSRSKLSAEIIVSELFFIFVLSTLGISSIIGGFRYEKIRKIY